MSQNLLLAADSSRDSVTPEVSLSCFWTQCSSLQASQLDNCPKKKLFSILFPFSSSIQFVSFSNCIIIISSKFQVKYPVLANATGCYPNLIPKPPLASFNASADGSIHKSKVRASRTSCNSATDMASKSRICQEVTPILFYHQSIYLYLKIGNESVVCIFVLQ